MKHKFIWLLCLLLLLPGCSTATAASAQAQLPQLHTSVIEKQALNSDTVGWLQVPGTDIDEVVVQNSDPEDRNMFYFRRDFDQNYSFDGCYYADYRCSFPPGAMGKSTVIYGHSLADDPDGERFSQLLRYRDPAFADEHPFIYFADTEQTMAWQVFAVSILTVDVPYNVPTLDDSERLQTIALARERSVHAFGDITVTEADDILVLSTEDNTHPFPNDYRYVVMAKRVD